MFYLLYYIRAREAQGDCPRVSHGLIMVFIAEIITASICRTINNGITDLDTLFIRHVSNNRSATILQTIVYIMTNLPAINPRSAYAQASWSITAFNKLLPCSAGSYSIIPISIIRILSSNTFNSE